MSTLLNFMNENSDENVTVDQFKNKRMHETSKNIMVFDINDKEYWLGRKTAGRIDNEENLALVTTIIDGNRWVIPQDAVSSLGKQAN